MQLCVSFSSGGSWWSSFLSIYKELILLTTVDLMDLADRIHLLKYCVEEFSGIEIFIKVGSRNNGWLLYPESMRRAGY